MCLDVDTVILIFGDFIILRSAADRFVPGASKGRTSECCQMMGLIGRT